MKPVQDQDAHACTAAAFYDVPIQEATKEQRRMGKVLNFTALYGGNIPSFKEEKEAP